MWSGYVREHLLPRLFGFELLMAPYAVAHLKLGMQLAAQDLPEAQRKDWAYDFAGDERLGVYLTNTLEEAHEAVRAPVRLLASSPTRPTPPPRSSATCPSWSSWATRPTPATRPTRASGSTAAQANCTDGRRRYYYEWTASRWASATEVAPGRLRQVHPLRPSGASSGPGHGILAFITNHGYLDNPTFRGMREH